MKTKKLPPWSRYSAVVDTKVRFRFRDRLRILFRGSIILRSGTICERFPGRTAPIVEVLVRPILNRKSEIRNPQ